MKRFLLLALFLTSAFAASSCSFNQGYSGSSSSELEGTDSQSSDSLIGDSSGSSSPSSSSEQSEESMYIAVFDEETNGYSLSVNYSYFEGSYYDAYFDIPDYYAGDHGLLPVTVLAANGFDEICPFNVSFPLNLVKIGDNCFSWSSVSDRDLYLPRGLKEIGQNVFHLETSVHIPITVEKIGKNAFDFYRYQNIYCEAAEKPPLWDDEWQTGINEVRIYWGLYDLVEDGSDTYQIIDYEGKQSAVYSIISRSDVELPETFELPSSYVYMGQEIPVVGTFKKGKFNGVRRCIVPEGYRFIGPWTFAYVEDLSKIELPNTIEYIGEGAFYSTSLTSFTAPSSLVTIGQSAFAHTKISELSLNAGLKTIEDSAFSSCAGFVMSSFPESLEYIGGAAFASSIVGSPSFMVLDGAIKYIGHSAFWGSEIEGFIIGPSVEYIGDDAFNGFNAARHCTVFVSRECDYVGSGAFGRCYFYSDAEHRPDGWDLNWSYGVSSITWGCDDFRLHEGQAYLYDDNYGGYKFIGCAGVKVLNIPDEIDGIPVTAIDEVACYSNSSIESLVFGKNVKYIGTYAFNECSNLGFVDASKTSLQLTGTTPFYLTRIDVFYLPKAIEIEDEMVCSLFDDVGIAVVAEDSVFPLQYDPYISCESFYVPYSEREAVDDYLRKFHFSLYSDTQIFFEGPEDDSLLSDVTNGRIYFNASLPFEQDDIWYCSYLDEGEPKAAITSSYPRLGREEALVLADEVTSLGVTSAISVISPYAFYGYTYVAKNTIEGFPSKVEYVGSYAMYSALFALDDIYLPRTLKTIGSYAFGGSDLDDASRHTTIWIPNSVDTIGRSAIGKRFSKVNIEAESVPNGWSSDWCRMDQENIQFGVSFPY